MHPHFAQQFRRLLLRLRLHVLLKIASMGVDADRQRPQPVKAKLPNTFRHQVFPINRFDFLQLQCFHCRRAAGHAQVTRAVLLHQFRAARDKPPLPRIARTP